MSTRRYDVIYHSDHVSVEPHHCREWDEDGGCYGTNPDHGCAWGEACKIMAAYHTQQARLWLAEPEPEE